MLMNITLKFTIFQAKIFIIRIKKINKIIDLDKFPDGIYTIKIFSKEINYISKLIINN